MINKQKISKLCIEFTIPNNNQKSNAISNLEKNVFEIFGEDSIEIENFTDENGIVTITYQIPSPFIRSKNVNKAFFSDLLNLFSSTDYLHPRFTQRLIGKKLL